MDASFRTDGRGTIACFVSCWGCNATEDALPRNDPFVCGLRRRIGLVARGPHPGGYNWATRIVATASTKLYVGGCSGLLHLRFML